MPQRILGIDIGSYSIKVAEIESTMKTFSLVGFFEQPIVAYETLGREGSITQALLKLFEEYNLSTSLVYSAIPGQFASHRLIDLPFADFKKVDQTIEFEMENYVPLPLEDLLIDYETLTSSKTGSTAMVGYAKKSDFVKYLNIMTGADIDPRFVGSEPVELANVMKLGVFQPEGAYALVDLGHEKSNVLIFLGPKLQFARTIMVGGRDLTHAIAEKLNIPAAEAERMKIEMGQIGPEVEGADATTRNVSEAIKAPLEDLLLQLKQTFMAFQEVKGEVVQALLLTGGTSRLPGIDHYLSERLRKNISFLDCLDFPFNQLSDSEWCRPIAAQALALAYRGVIGTTIKDIQFRRGEFAFKGEVKDLGSLAKQLVFLMGVVVVFAAASMATGYVTLKSRMKSQSSKIAAIASEALPDMPKKSLGNPSAVLSTLTGKIADAEEKRKKVGEETSLLILDVLKEFSASLPAREELKLDVDDLTIASRRIRIQGRTSSFEAIDQIKAALGKSKFFKNVATDNVKKGVRDEVRFNLSVELVGGEEEGA